MSLITKMFPQELQAFIEAKGLSLEAFKKKYNFSEGTMRRMLRGQVEHLRGETYDKIAAMMKDRRWAAIAPPPRKRRGPRKSAGPAIDKSQVINYRAPVVEGEYVQNQLVPFVVGWPARMPEEERAMWKELLEQQLVSLDGLESGHYVVRETASDRYQHREANHRPIIMLRERPGKVIRRALANFYSTYVEGRTFADVVTDGLNLLLIEFDLDGKQVLDAWRIDGVVFSNTGIAPARRDINQPHVEKVVYKCYLYGHVHQDNAVLAEADWHLQELNSRVPPPPQQE
jgi:hypothetical protein